MFTLSPVHPDAAPQESRSRVRIYQLFVRLFGNTNPTRKVNGTLAENGTGKFADINDAALSSLKEMGFTHLWLTGVLQQATSTDYSAVGKPADDPDLLKGLAGSPYAVKDYFDVSPDYAQDPAKRLDEFAALLERVHGYGMKALIDFVPNHVARCYHSTVHPEFDFGTNDDKTQFFRRDNNFYYLQPGDPAQGQVPPLKLPTYDFYTGKPLSATCQVLGTACDGYFAGERDFGRVTGNNEVSWTPSKDSWYETIKLNYGFDFTDPEKRRREYPRPDALDIPIPDTWRKMDHVLAHWQSLGVDGFRCDMAHMIPPEFWKWVIAQARARQPEVYFIAEAYDDDPAKVPPSGDGGVYKHEMQLLLEAGFDSVYDDPSYKTVKRIYEGPAWANDLDNASRNERIFESGLRYAENHDEVRLAAPDQWGGVGMNAGRAACGALFALSRGPVMIYSGQEVGEPAQGVTGFGGGNARTTIFDYWSMPELMKWVNGHAYDGALLSPEQKDLRAFYGRLLRTAGEPAFRDGLFHPLNPGNTYSANYGRTDGDPASGHWLYACLRYDPATSQRFLVVVNMHRFVSFEHVNIYLSKEALEFLDLGHAQTGGNVPALQFVEHVSPDAYARIEQHTESADSTRLDVLSIPPLTPFYFEIKTLD